MKNKIGQLFNKTAIMFLFLIVLFLFFAILTGGKNLNSANINNLVMQNGYVIVLSVGMLLCCLTGNIDLGIGSVVAASGAVAATLLVQFNVNFIIAMIASIGVGVIFGLFNGLVISKLHIPPFIVTLATMLIARGLSYVVLKGTTVGPLPDEYCYISIGFLPTIKLGRLDLLSFIIGLLICGLLVFLDIRDNANKKKYRQAFLPLWAVLVKDVFISILVMFVAIKLGLYNGLPILMVILLAIVVIYSVVTTQTVFGREIFAVGGNARAARLSGIDTDKVMFSVYLNMGLLCGIVGVLLSGRNASSTPNAGENFELDAITACYLGGVASNGGKGSVGNAVIGALIIGVLNNGMSLCGLDSNVQKIIKGLVLITAVAVDIISRKRLAKAVK